MAGDKPREQSLEDIVNEIEPVPQEPLNPDDFKTGKENPAVMRALDEFEKRREAAGADQTTASPEEAGSAKTEVARADIKQLADKYEGVRDEVARLSRELGAGDLNPKQAEFKKNIRENLKRDYFRELVGSVVTGNTKLGTEIVKLGMDYPEIAKDHPYQDMLQEISATLLENTQAKGQFEALISGPQKGEIAVQKLRERIAQNREGIMKGTRSRLEQKFGARGEKAKKLAANQDKARAPQAKVIEFKTKEQQVHEQMESQGVWKEIMEKLGLKPKKGRAGDKENKKAA